MSGPRNRGGLCVFSVFYVDVDDLFVSYPNVRSNYSKGNQHDFVSVSYSGCSQHGMYFFTATSLSTVLLTMTYEKSAHNTKAALMHAR
jgi:hypothetical protein